MTQVARQLAALALCLLTLMAFSTQVLADCLAEMPANGDDCHETVMSDCGHHMADQACMSAADCGQAEQAVPAGERKQDRDAEPDPLLTVPATGPPPASQPARLPATLYTYQSNDRRCYLHCCRFLE
ncbi:hypothetical protein J2T60_001557 [Natronospira proteinivora]|uniref:Kazal-type serine protease inhibitor-like protein n=1 Tax=Natronospira proteinivora TaxID=1807133 RepID=A0ABT1G942_9GAMM|nr:hypothetical protein [Natronospira proteinivora]MCP1727557.1 hypothetical protein [Natronospira proteinivora]